MIKGTRLNITLYVVYLVCILLSYLPKIKITLYPLTLKHLITYELKLKCKLSYFQLYVSFYNLFLSICTKITVRISIRSYQHQQSKHIHDIKSFTANKFNKTFLPGVRKTNKPTYSETFLFSSSGVIKIKFRMLCHAMF